MPKHFWGALIGYFLKCPLTGVCVTFFSWWRGNDIPWLLYQIWTSGHAGFLPSPPRACPAPWATPNRCPPVVWVSLCSPWGSGRTRRWRLYLGTWVHPSLPFTTMGTQPVPHATSCTLLRCRGVPVLQEGALREAVDQVYCDWSGGLYQLEARARGRACWAPKRVHPEAAKENQAASWGIGAEARVKAQNYCKTLLSAILLSLVSVTQVNRNLKILNEKFHK